MSNGSIQLLQQGPPPYVVFEQRMEEDRNKTIEKGSLVLKDVDYAIIHRHGSKDSVEKIASEWLDDIEKLSRAQPPAFPGEWVHAYRTRYKQWKDGLEVSPMGFPIRQWAAVSKATAENLAMANIRTVEDLAGASEEALSKIGMGARSLKERAVAWIESNQGNKGEELNALRVQNADLTARLDSQAQKIAELEAAIMNNAPRKRA